MKTPFDCLGVSKKTYLTIEGTEYLWRGLLGCVLQSHEQDVKPNDLREIFGVIFIAIRTYPGKWSKLQEVHWVPREDFDMKWIHLLALEVFGLARFVKEMND